MKNKHIVDILNEYEKLQDEAKSNQKRKQIEIYNKFPRIKQIDEEISRLGINIASSIFKGIDIEGFISEQKKRITDLKIEKSEILSFNKYPVNYLEIQFKCSKCKDTGYIDYEKCSCFKQKLIDKHYQQSNLKNILQKENFESFNISLYSSAKHNGYELSPRENMEKIFTYCISYANNVDNISDNLFFSGSPGLGKTFLSNCIAKDILDKGRTVIYQTSSNLIEVLRSFKFDENAPKDHVEQIMECDLLIIDDLGTESNTSYSQSELFNIINTRILRNKKMIISTNILIEDLDQYYPSRIISRICGHFKMFEFYGDDIRIRMNISRRKSGV